MNAAGRDLCGSEFVLHDLTGAVFDGCNLCDVRIHDCILKRASFRRAIFSGAQVGGFALDDLDEADFTDATINGIGFLDGHVFRTLYSLKLSPEQLVSTRSYKTKDLRQCMINGSWEGSTFDFRGARLERAVVANGDFTKCDFSGAHIHGVIFRNVTLAFEQLASTADFRRGRLSIHVQQGGSNAAGLTGKWDFTGIDLEGSDLSVQPGGDFTDASINGCTVRGGLTASQLYSTKSYKEGNLTHVSLARADLSGFNLSRMNLTRCSFQHCDLSDVVLEDAVITGVNFLSLVHVPTRVRWEWKGKCKGLTVGQIRSTWNYKNNHMNGIVLPDNVAEALKQEQEVMR